jgi:hypothetical protein
MFKGTEGAGVMRWHPDDWHSDERRSGKICRSDSLQQIPVKPNQAKNQTKSD